MSKEQYGLGYHIGLKDGMKARVSFRAFCEVLYQNENNPYGDFTYDVLHDSYFDEHKCLSYNDIYNHLMMMKACDGAIEAFKELYKEWERIRND